MAAESFAIGIDVGGTYSKLAAVSSRGAVLREAQLPTLPGLGPEDFLNRIVASVRRVESALGRKAKAAGLGLAGDVDGFKGVLRFAPNLKEFAGFGFKSALRSGLRLPVIVDNDANMAAWGGYVVELGRAKRDLVCITLGTGIGGGLVLDGKLYRGSTGVAGEIGHMVVEPDGAPCRCGARGCLEAYAGSGGIVRGARKLLEGASGGKSLLRRLCPNLTRLDPEILALAAQRGDRTARSAWRLAGRYLGIGICNLVYLLNPDAVLLVGGVSGAGPLILGPVLRAVRSQPFKTPFRRVWVGVAKTRNLGALGAALLSLEA